MDETWKPDEVARLVASHMSSMGNRWSHGRAVGRAAESLAADTGRIPEVVVSAAWLHDIGYASLVQATGFHPLDGARFPVRAVGPRRAGVARVAEGRRSQSSADTYQRQLANHVLPALGQLTLGELTTPLIDKFISRTKVDVGAQGHLPWSKAANPDAAKASEKVLREADERSSQNEKHG